MTHPVKQRWKECDAIASRLESVGIRGFNKNHVYNAYQSLKSAGLIDAIDAIGERQLTEEQERRIKAELDRSYSPGKQPEMTSSDLLKVAFWFIKKCGNDPSLAKKTLDVAAEAMQAMERTA